MKYYSRLKRNMRLRLTLPFISYEINLNDFLDNTDNSDARIDKLGKIKNELESVIIAVDSLSGEAKARKEEAERLREVVVNLNEERSTLETILKLPKDTFSNLLNKASAKGRWRGLMEGAIVGFVTGIISSYLVWLFTSFL